MAKVKTFAWARFGTWGLRVAAFASMTCRGLRYGAHVSGVPQTTAKSQQPTANSHCGVHFSETSINTYKPMICITHTHTHIHAHPQALTHSSLNIPLGAYVSSRAPEQQLPIISVEHLFSGINKRWQRLAGAPA